MATPTRVPALPDVPTFKELGYKNLVATNWFGLVAPKGTPTEIVERLNSAINQVLTAPEYRDIVEGQGAIVAGGSAAEFDTLLKAERARWCDVISSGGITTDR